MSDPERAVCGSCDLGCWVADDVRALQRLGPCSGKIVVRDDYGDGCFEHVCEAHSAALDAEEWARMDRKDKP